MRQFDFAPVECDDWLDPLSPAYERQQAKRLAAAEAEIVKHGHKLAEALREHYWASVSLRHVRENAGDGRLRLSESVAEYTHFIEGKIERRG
jgi:hypothetical protein